MEILELGISGSKSRQNNGIDINKNNKGKYFGYIYRRLTTIFSKRTSIRSCSSRCRGSFKSFIQNTDK